MIPAEGRRLSNLVRATLFYLFCFGYKISIIRARKDRVLARGSGLFGKSGTAQWKRLSGIILIIKPCDRRCDRLQTA